MTYDDFIKRLTAAKDELRSMEVKIQIEHDFDEIRFKISDSTKVVDDGEIDGEIELSWMIYISPNPYKDQVPGEEIDNSEYEEKLEAIQDAVNKRLDEVLDRHRLWSCGFSEV